MNPRRPQKERKHKLNSEVRFPQVRLVGEGEPRIMSSFEASKIAQSEGKDLILINENQDPPIVRIEDYNKFIYDFEKAQKLKQKSQQKIELREIQLSCEIAINDLQTKARKAREFLEDGDKVKWVYLKTNPLGLDTVAFKDYNDPKEIMDFVEQYVDRDMIYKAELENKVDDFYNALKWEKASNDTKTAKKFFAF